jgi:TusA-related sulfurtransferase
LLIALKEVNAQRTSLQSGDKVIHILTDSRQSTNTIPGSVKNMGYQSEILKKDGYYCIEVRK